MVQSATTWQCFEATAEELAPQRSGPSVLSDFFAFRVRRTRGFSARGCNKNSSERAYPPVENSPGRPQTGNEGASCVGLTPRGCRTVSTTPYPQPPLSP